MAVIWIYNPNKQLLKQKHFPEFQIRGRKCHFLSEQLHITWEEHSRKKVKVEAFKKNNIQETH